MLINGSTLDEGTIEGLVTLPGGLVVTRMEIEVASWGLNYKPDDIIVYDPAMRACFLYEEVFILNLPDPDEIIIFSDQQTGSLREYLEDEPYVVYDSQLGMMASMDLYLAGAPFPLSWSYAPPLTGIDGDVNLDGNIDLFDAVLTLQVCAGIKPAEDVNGNADINDDGRIGLAEVIYILQRISGLR